MRLLSNTTKRLSGTLSERGIVCSLFPLPCSLFRNWPTTYTVDALNRTSAKLYMDGTRVTNTWDAASQQLTCADTTGTTSFVWDLDGRKTATQNPTGINLTTTMDGASNRLVLADPYGRTTYTHDIQSRLTRIQNPLNEVTSIQWDPLDREQHRVLGNGGSVSHVYDAGGRETVLQNISSAGVAQAVFTNAYDALSNRLSVIELDNTRVSFSYDKTSQIVNEQRTGADAHNTTYVWDPLGNRLQEINSGLTTTRTFSPTNSQLESVPPTGPATTNAWDTNGNLAVANTGGALTTNLWDPENRLSHVAFSDGTSESYLTSQDGLRKSKTTGSGTTVYTWDDENVLLETNTSNVVQARFTDFPGYWGGVASQNRSGVSSFFFFDTQGSTRLLTSILGLITDVYSYMSFGIELQSGSGTLNDLRYIGQFGYKRERPNVNLARRRILFSIDGQWDRRDPIGFDGGDVNVFGYVENNPANYLDPSGRVTISVAAPDEWHQGTWPGKPGQACHPRVCGEQWAIWFFTRTNPSRQCKDGKPGWFVQHVTSVGRYWNCPASGGGIPDSQDYYEAIELSSATVQQPDISGRLPQPGKMGQNYKTTRHMRFYCDSSATGIRMWPNVGKMKKYGGSPATPPFWKNAPGDQGETEAVSATHADWCCCNVPFKYYSKTGASPPAPGCSP